MGNIQQQIGFAPLLILDGGHGITTPERRTPPLDDGTVVQEYEFNKGVVALADMYARNAGFRTFLTSPTEEDTPLAVRTARANQAYNDYRAELQRQGINTQGLDPAIFISVHYNTLGTEFQNRANGVETFYFPGSVKGQRLAELLRISLLQGTPQVDRGTKPANYYVLRRTQMPAALIEAGFMDYKPEAELMASQAFREEVAREIVAAALQYYGFNQELG